MIIAIPSVTRYISDSRKSTYVDTAHSIISGARNMVNEGKLFMYDHFEEPSFVNEILVKNGLKVSSLSFSSNGFEDYFIERLGK